MQNEWVVDSGCTHHMDKDASLFTWLYEAKERKIYVVDDFAMDVVGQGDVACQHGIIVGIYHVPNVNANTLLCVAQLTQTGKIVEFWPDQFYIHDLKKGNSIVVGGILNLMDSLYKFYDMTRLEPKPTTLVSHTDE
jgi:hypothetical protein